MRMIGAVSAQYMVQNNVYGKAEKQAETPPSVTPEQDAVARSAPLQESQADPAVLTAAQTARAAYLAAQAQKDAAPVPGEKPGEQWLADAAAQNKGSMAQAAQAMAEALKTAPAKKPTGESGKTSMSQTAETLAQALGMDEEQTETVKSFAQQKDEEVKNLLDMMEESRKKAKEMREKLKLPKNAQRYGEAAVEAYARLKRARSASQVSAASGYARRQLAQMQSALHSDSENAPRIRAAIRNLQSAISRASRKKRELTEEQSEAARAKRAAEQKRRGAAARIQAEQQRRKAARFVRESGYIRGAVLDHMQQEYMAQERAAAAERLEAAVGSDPAGGAAPCTPASL